MSRVRGGNPNKIDCLESQPLPETTSRTKCQVCGQRADQPMRQIKNGKIQVGCVARIHDGFLDTASESAAFVRRSLRQFNQIGFRRLDGIRGQ